MLNSTSFASFGFALLCTLTCYAQATDITERDTKRRSRLPTLSIMIPDQTDSDTESPRSYNPRINRSESNSSKHFRFPRAQTPHVLLAVNALQKKAENKVRILNLAGGGVRGLMQLYFLSRLEDETQKSIPELFDMVVGTSIGGILATLLTKKDPLNPNKAKYSATYLLNFFENHSQEMFQTKWFSGFGLFKTKYRATSMEKLLNELLGDDKFEDRLIPTVVTSFSLNTGAPKVFYSTSKSELFNTVDVAMATSAAPTYFKPREVVARNAKRGIADRYILVDGGVYANDPLAVAMDAGLSYFNKDAANTIMVSVGTGQSSEIKDNSRLLRGGVIAWSKNIIDIMFAGQNGTYSDESVEVKKLSVHSKWNPTLPAEHMTLDNTSEENAEALLRASRLYTDRNRNRLTELGELLTQISDQPVELNRNQSTPHFPERTLSNFASSLV